MAGMLRISDAASLGLHAAAYLASEGTGRPVPVARMAEDLRVSEAHLGKVLQRLARLGLIRSRRGPGGGFLLARRPEEIALIEIHEAFEGPIPRPGCLLGRERPCKPEACVMGDLVHRVQRMVREHLERTRLSDLAPALAPPRSREDPSPISEGEET